MPSPSLNIRIEAHVQVNYSKTGGMRCFPILKLATSPIQLCGDWCHSVVVSVSPWHDVKLGGNVSLSLWVRGIKPNNRVVGAPEGSFGTE